MPRALLSLSPPLPLSLLLCPEPGPILAGDMGRRRWRHRPLPLASYTTLGWKRRKSLSECCGLTHSLTFTVSVLFPHDHTGSQMRRPGSRHAHPPHPQSTESLCASFLTPGLLWSSGETIAKEALGGSVGNSDLPGWIRAQGFEATHNEDFKLKINQDIKPGLAMNVCVDPSTQKVRAGRSQFKTIL